MKIKDYKDLDVWKKGIDIVDVVYDITARFPSDERFGLVQQMRRCAVSIPANISEGFARQHRKEYKQFLFISLGSCAELETQLIIAYRRKYLSETDFQKVTADIQHESRMLMKLIKSLDAYDSERLATGDQRLCVREEMYDE